jgi:hypothetical protein
MMRPATRPVIGRPTPARGTSPRRRSKNRPSQNRPIMAAVAPPAPLEDLEVRRLMSVAHPAPPPAATLLHMDGSPVNAVMPFGPDYHGDMRLAVGDFDGDGVQEIAAATGPGSPGRVAILRQDGTPVTTITPFGEDFTSGIRITAGDVNADGRDEVIVAAAGNGGHAEVKAIDAATGAVVLDFTAFRNFEGDVRLAAGDVNRDGYVDVIASAGEGAGPHVRVFSGADMTVLHSFWAFDPAFHGGVSVASVDINRDGYADIITGSGPGGGSQVKVFDGYHLRLMHSFSAYDPGFTGGVSVATIRTADSPVPRIVTAAGAGEGPQVKIFSAHGDVCLSSFWAYDPGYVGGVTLASGTLKGLDSADLITAPGMASAQ